MSLVLSYSSACSLSEAASHGFFEFTRISFFSFGLLSKNDPNKDAHFQASAFGSLVAAPQHGWAADFRFMAHWGAHPSVDRLSRTTRAPSAARPPAAGPADAAKFRSAQAALGLSCTRGPAKGRAWAAPRAAPHDVTFVSWPRPAGPTAPLPRGRRLQLHPGRSQALIDERPAHAFELLGDVRRDRPSRTLAGACSCPPPFAERIPLGCVTNAQQMTDGTSTMGSTSAHDRRRARPSQRISSHPRLWLCLDYGSVLAMVCLVASAAGFPASSTMDAAQATLRRTAVLGFVETDGCKAWCADHTASLRVKCTYAPCTTCEECTGVDMSAPIPIDERDPLALNTTLLHAPSPTEAIKPTSASPPAVAFTLPAIETIVPTVGGCKSWCADHTAALEVKCTYTTCSACAECEPINGKMINTDEPTLTGPTSPATSHFGSPTMDDVASSPCVDDASFPCVAWAKSGECQRIPVFMLDVAEADLADLGPSARDFGRPSCAGGE